MFCDRRSYLQTSLFAHTYVLHNFVNHAVNGSSKSLINSFITTVDHYFDAFVLNSLTLTQLHNDLIHFFSTCVRISIGSTLRLLNVKSICPLL